MGNRSGEFEEGLLPLKLPGGGLNLTRGHLLHAAACQVMVVGYWSVSASPKPTSTPRKGERGGCVPLRFPPGASH
jgi:hypothetical protein